jgi:hypothetical protein
MEKEKIMHVKINTAALVEEEVPINNSAAALVRMGFNPSTLPKVDRVKALAAAFISECEAIKAEDGPGAREAAIAITDMQKTSMMAVAAATADL